MLIHKKIQLNCCVEPLHHLGEQGKVGVVAACRAVHLLIALPEAKVTFLCIEHQHKYVPSVQNN